MCKAFLCEIYQQELKGARKRLSQLRQHKRWGHWPETIDLEIETAQQCVAAAKAKIDGLHMQRAGQVK